MLDVDRDDQLERELSRIIERRSREEPDRDEREEAWKASVRAYNASKEAERRAAWATYHVGQASRLRRVMTNLVEHHENKARQLSSENEGKETA